MKNVLRNYNDYMTAKGKIDSDLKKELSTLSNYYTGAYLVEKEAKLKQEAFLKLEALKEKHVSAIKAEFESTKNRVKGVVMKPIPENTLNMLKSVEGMTLTDLEKEELLNMTKGNYMARRKVLDILGSDYLVSTPTADSLVQTIDELHGVMNNTIVSERENEYMIAVLQNGQWVNRIEGEVSSFLQAYE